MADPKPKYTSLYTFHDNEITFCLLASFEKLDEGTITSKRSVGGSEYQRNIPPTSRYGRESEKLDNQFAFDNPRSLRRMYSAELASQRPRTTGPEIGMRIRRFVVAVAAWPRSTLVQNSPVCLWMVHAELTCNHVHTYVSALRAFSRAWMFYPTTEITRSALKIKYERAKLGRFENLKVIKIRENDARRWY